MRYHPKVTLQALVLFIVLLCLGYSSSQTGSEGVTAGGLLFTAWQVIKWLAVIELLSFLILPLVTYALAPFPDAGFGLAKALGWLAGGYVIWVLQSLKILSFNPAAVWLVIILGLLSSIALRRFFMRENLWRRKSKHMLWSELFFLGSFFAFVTLRAFQPEIFWGEKPMDFTFLNYFTRIEALPPEDPWCAGQKMDYYYLGSYYFALLQRLAAIPPGIGYNLAIATIPAFFGAALFSALCFFTRKRLLSGITAAAFLFCSNLEWLRLFFAERLNPDFQFFWSTTRLFHYPFFVEYPIWSFLFADLHAHVMALPILAVFCVLALSIIFETPRPGRQARKQGSSRPAALLLLALVWGNLMGMNSWDFIAAGFALAIFILVKLTFNWSREILCDEPAPGAFRNFFISGAKLIAEQCLVVCCALLFIYPFTSNLHASDLPWGWVTKVEWAGPAQLLRHLGGWISIAALAFSLVLAGRSKKTAGTPAPRSRIGRMLKFAAVVLFWTMLAILPALASVAAGYNHSAWGITVFLAVVCLFAITAVTVSEEPLVAYSAALLCAALALIELTQVFYLRETLNTIFKAYNAIWLLSGLAAVTAIGCLLEQLPKLRTNKLERLSAGLAAAGAGIILTLSVLGGALMICIILPFQRVAGPRPTLDGTAYLTTQSPGKAQLISWINGNVTGTPVLLEAHGHSYGDFTRVSMHTGLPTVLGWEYHVSQRGAPAGEVTQRSDDVRTLYSTLDWDLALKLINKYSVRYIVVGDLERRIYAPAGLDKFEAAPAHFRPVFRMDQWVLYRVAG